MTTDFDIDIKEILLARRNSYYPGYKSLVYRNGRNMAGVVYCLSGKALYTLGRESFYLREGQLVFFPATSAYTVECWGDEPFVHITANFNLVSELNQADSTVSGIFDGSIIYICDKEKGKKFKKLFESLDRVWRGKNNGYNILAKSIIYEILYMYLCDAQETYSNTDEYNRVVKARDMIDENYMQDISVAELAEVCGLSESHFRRCFVENFAYSPIDYKIRKRILKARDMLLSGDFSVSEVALAVGFSDVNYFSRIFKKRTGMTPLEFRRKS